MLVFKDKVSKRSKDPLWNPLLLCQYIHHKISYHGNEFYITSTPSNKLGKKIPNNVETILEDTTRPLLERISDYCKETIEYSNSILSFLNQRGGQQQTKKNRTEIYELLSDVFGEYNLKVLQAQEQEQVDLLAEFYTMAYRRQIADLKVILILLNDVRTVIKEMDNFEGKCFLIKQFCKFKLMEKKQNFEKSYINLGLDQNAISHFHFHLSDIRNALFSTTSELDHLFNAYTFYEALPAKECPDFSYYTLNIEKLFEYAKRTGDAEIPQFPKDDITENPIGEKSSIFDLYPKEFCQSRGLYSEEDHGPVMMETIRFYVVAKAIRESRKSKERMKILQTKGPVKIPSLPFFEIDLEKDQEQIDIDPCEEIDLELDDESLNRTMNSLSIKSRSHYKKKSDPEILPLGFKKDKKENKMQPKSRFEQYADDLIKKGYDATFEAILNNSLTDNTGKKLTLKDVRHCVALCGGRFVFGKSGSNMHLLFEDLHGKENWYKLPPKTGNIHAPHPSDKNKIISAHVLYLISSAMHRAGRTMENIFKKENKKSKYKRPE